MQTDLQRLKESNEFLAAVLENVLSAVCLVDKDVCIRDFNDSFLSTFGKTEDQVQGQLCGNAMGCAHVVREKRDCGETSHCEDCGLRHSILAALVEKAPTCRALLVRRFHVNGKGTIKHFRYSTAPVVYRSEEMVLGILDDITDNEIRSRHYEKLIRTKDRSLSLAAHDLRNPVGIMRGFLELFQEGTFGSLTEQQGDIVRQMTGNCERILSLIDNLLDARALESGKVELERRETDLSDLLRAAHSSNSLLAKCKSIDLKLETDDGLPHVTADAGRLNQVLDNLVSNAVKFSLPGTTVDIRAHARSNRIEISVTDQGPGIPEREMRKLFTEFGKTSVQPTGGERCTGLGLSIARSIVEAHGGRIWAESHPGAGSTFTFALPLRAQEASAHAR